MLVFLTVLIKWSHVVLHVVLLLMVSWSVILSGSLWSLVFLSMGTADKNSLTHLHWECYYYTLLRSRYMSSVSSAVMMHIFESESGELEFISRSWHDQGVSSTVNCCWDSPLSKWTIFQNLLPVSQILVVSLLRVLTPVDIKANEPQKVKDLWAKPQSSQKLLLQEVFFSCSHILFHICVHWISMLTGTWETKSIWCQ